MGPYRRLRCPLCFGVTAPSRLRDWGTSSVPHAHYTCSWVGQCTLPMPIQILFDSLCIQESICNEGHHCPSNHTKRIFIDSADARTFIVLEPFAFLDGACYLFTHCLSDVEVIDLLFVLFLLNT